MGVPGWRVWRGRGRPFIFRCRYEWGRRPRRGRRPLIDVVRMVGEEREISFGAFGGGFFMRLGAKMREKIAASCTSVQVSDTTMLGYATVAGSPFSFFFLVSNWRSLRVRRK